MVFEFWHCALIADQQSRIALPGNPSEKESESNSMRSREKVVKGDLWEGEDLLDLLEGEDH